MHGRKLQRGSTWSAPSLKRCAHQRRLPVAQELGETSLMFQVHPTLTEQNMRYVAESARRDRSPSYRVIRLRG